MMNWRLVVALCALAFLSLPRAAAAQVGLSGNRFICTVSPGYGGQRGPMILRVQLTPTIAKVWLPTIPPSEGWWTIIANNDVGVVAASGGAVALPGYNSSVTGQLIFIMRQTSMIRWTESGADNQPAVDRFGSCVADAPG